MLLWRRAREAYRDASCVFQAACTGRPLELAKRLRLGKLAQGHTRKGFLPTGHFVTPLAAAALERHAECVEVLRSHGAPMGQEYNAILPQYAAMKAATSSKADKRGGLQRSTTDRQDGLERQVASLAAQLAMALRRIEVLEAAQA